MMRPLAAFVRLSRLKFLAGGFVGGALGTAVAAYERGVIDWPAYALAQFTITAFHLMTHYSNDYFDRESDARSIRTPFSGGSGALVDGSLPPHAALMAALVCLCAGIAGIALLATHAMPYAAAIAGAIAVLAWSYSSPPLRLLERGLGEANTAVVVAVLVPLCAFAAQGLAPDPTILTSVLPGASAMFGMMLCVEVPDIAADASTGKRNLVVRFPRRWPAFVAATAVSIYAATALAIVAGAPPTLALFEILTLPLAWSMVRAAQAPQSAPHAEEALAGRGVALFFVVSCYALLAYAAVLRL